MYKYNIIYKYGTICLCFLNIVPRLIHPITKFKIENAKPDGKD